MHYGALRGYGESGWGWSRSAVTYTSATLASIYPLYFSASAINPSNGPYTRWYSFPVRCLVYIVKKRKTLYFVRSGYVNLSTGALRDFGVYGLGWSRIATVYGAGTWVAKAYVLGFYASDVNPSNAYVRWVGYPVRCLVYQFDMLKLGSKQNCLWDPKGLFEVKAPAPRGSLINKDREVALHLFQRELQKLA